MAQILAMLCAWKGREPFEGAEERIKVGVWNSSLEDVPTGELLALTRAELRDRTSPFMPTPADLLARFRGEETGRDDNGCATRDVRANVAAYENYHAAQARQADAPMLAAPPVPLEIEPEELKRRLGVPGSQPASVVAGEGAGEDETERHGAAVVEVARVLNVDLDACTPQQLVDLRAYALWWLRRFPHRVFTFEAWETTWNIFVDERTWKANAQRSERQIDCPGIGTGSNHD